MKEALAKARFGNYEDVKNEVSKWLVVEVRRDYFNGGIEKTITILKMSEPS